MQQEDKGARLAIDVGERHMAMCIGRRTGAHLEILAVDMMDLGKKCGARPDDAVNAARRVRHHALHLADKAGVKKLERVVIERQRPQNRRACVLETALASRFRSSEHPSPLKIANAFELPSSSYRAKKLGAIVAADAILENEHLSSVPFPKLVKPYLAADKRDDMADALLILAWREMGDEWAARVAAELRSSGRAGPRRPAKALRKAKSSEAPSKVTTTTSEAPSAAAAKKPRKKKLAKLV